jgi:hypothetical protein
MKRVVAHSSQFFMETESSERTPSTQISDYQGINYYF